MAKRRIMLWAMSIGDAATMLGVDCKRVQSLLRAGVLRRSGVRQHPLVRRDVVRLSLQLDTLPTIPPTTCERPACRPTSREHVPGTNRRNQNDATPAYRRGRGTPAARTIT